MTRIRSILLPTLATGLLVLLAYAVGVSSRPLQFFEVLAVTLSAAVASMAVGALIGLLFGIPRALTSIGADSAAPGVAEGGRRRYGGNSNLVLPLT